MKYIKADNGLCLSALLEMIISGVRPELSLTQKKIAEYFGLTLYPGQTTTIKNVRFSYDDKDIGISVDKKDLTELFSEFGIPLTVKYYHCNPYENYGLESVESNQLNKSKYVVFTFSYGQLYDIPDLLNVGHAALLEQYLDTRIIKIYDPGPRDYGHKFVSLAKMYKAIEQRDGGVYVFGG